MNDDPSTDRLTQYHSGECFRNEKLPLYISKAARAQKPFGTIMIELGKQYTDATTDAEREQIVTDIRSVIETAKIPGQNEAFAPDVKAREENRFYLLMRFADDIECRHILHALYDSLIVNGYAGTKLAAKSFDPATSHVNAPQVLSDLESMLK